MKFLHLFSLVFLMFSMQSVELPKRTVKKIHSEVKKVYGWEDFDIENVSLNQDLNQNLPLPIKENQFFKIIVDGQPEAYIYLGSTLGHTNNFDYLLVLNADLSIASNKVIAYREAYGGEISSKRWLRQFVGKQPGDSLIYKQNIAAISGATISVKAMCRDVNLLLESLEILLKDKGIS